MRSTFLLNEHMAEKFSEDEKDAARSLLAALEPFRAMRPTIPLQYVLLFLNIVLEEGKSVSEYERDLGTPQTVMSRHLKEIGERTRSKQEGLGLVRQHTDINDMRRHLVNVTPLGKATMHKVKLALHGVRKKLAGCAKSPAGADDMA
jgi:DNA-binding MarR family transcriptional regulator